MLNDLRFCLRLFRRSPGFVFVAIVTLALGIGINTAIFSIFDAVLLRPLPYPESDRLVQIWETNRKDGGRDVVSPVNLTEWRESTSAFSAAAAYGWQSAILTGRGDPERLVAARVSGEFFNVFRISPAFGRAIVPMDVQAGAEPVVVLSHRTWRERFGAGRNVVGTFVTLDGVSTRHRGCDARGLRGARSGSADLGAARVGPATVAARQPLSVCGGPARPRRRRGGGDRADRTPSPNAPNANHPARTQVFVAY